MTGQDKVGEGLRIEEPITTGSADSKWFGHFHTSRTQDIQCEQHALRGGGLQQESGQ